MSTLKHILSEKPEPIHKAGLHPTADQIELYAYHLPNSTLSNLVVGGKNLYFLYIYDGLHICLLEFSGC